jgi:thiamine biosynthesis lipoprotein
MAYLSFLKRTHVLEWGVLFVVNHTVLMSKYHTFQRYLMGTDISISVLSTSEFISDVDYCFSLFSSYEQEFSRFLPESRMSIINQSKQWIISSRFLDIFRICLDVHKETDWYFNPLVNLSALWYAWDFQKWIFQKKNIAVENLDLNQVRIEWNTLLLQTWQQLDFWWIVKWYCVDQVALYLHKKWYQDFIVNAWGDIYVSWKNELHEIPVIGILDPWFPWENLATLEWSNMSVSTSWVYKRNWEIQGESYHHIISPIWEKNKKEIISITLVTDRCYLSDAYATSCIAMGIEKALVFLKKKNIPAFLLSHSWEYFTTGDMWAYDLCFERDIKKGSTEAV